MNACPQTMVTHSHVKQTADGRASKRDRVEAAAHSEVAASLEGTSMALTTGSEAVADTDENPSKRRHLESVSEGASYLEAVNDNCLLVILRLLPVEDTNTFAVCSQRCREIRSNPLLDQTRTGTIICIENSSIPKIYEAIAMGHWNNELYSGNRTHLLWIGLERVADIAASTKDVGDDVSLKGVTSLDLSCSPHDNHRMLWLDPLCGLALILPNLRELDLSYVRHAKWATLLYILSLCPHLYRLTWNGSSETSLRLTRPYFINQNLTEVYLDNRFFRADELQYILPMRYFEEEPTHSYSANFYMLMHFQNLERVSIKNTMCKWKTEYTREDEVLPLSQATVIKFIRHTPTLRWLRSNLTLENVAMLQKERPNITFVND